MIRNSSKSSINKKSFYHNTYTNHYQLLLNKIQSTLQQASNNLPYNQFYPLFINIILSIIKKFQIQIVDQPNLNYLSTITHKYNPNLQISVKLILLQVKSQLKHSYQQNLSLLNKAKHIIIDTQYEYLLPKIFMLESKIYQGIYQNDLQIKCLFKAIDFAENFVLEYLNHKQDIRKQIVQNIVIAYFQLYKLKKQDNHAQAEEYLRKAFRMTQKNYGLDSQVAQILKIALNQHKNIGKSLQKMNFSIKTPQKAFTDIMINQIKKDFKVYGFYLWQDQKIVVELIKTINSQEKIISGTQYLVKLDMSKINQLKSLDWVKIQNGEVIIIQEEVLKVTGVKQQNTVTTRIGIKNITRDQIIKKDSLSSSSEDPSFIQKEDFNFIRKLGRTQSAKRQLNI